jgi:hypothetical protein
MFTKRVINFNAVATRSLATVACASLLGLSSVANGQGMIDIAYNWGGGSPSGAAYWGMANDQWNIYNAFNAPTGGPFALMNVAGAGTGATMSYSASGGVQSATSNTQPDPQLTNYYLYNNASGPIVISLDGLTPNQEYAMVLYVSSNDAGGGDRSLMGTVTGSGTTNFAATGDPQATFVTGFNIVTLTAMSDSTGALTITENDGPLNTSGEVDMNGLQIQAVPEPAPMAALGIGILGLLSVRRRRTRA